MTQTQDFMDGVSKEISPVKNVLMKFWLMLHFNMREMFCVGVILGMALAFFISYKAYVWRINEFKLAGVILVNGKDGMEKFILTK